MRCSDNRYFKKATVAGTLTLRERYLYRGYLQIAAFDVTSSSSGESTGETESTLSSQLSHALKHVIFWDPTEPVATRPLAINIINGGIYFPTTDLTKNVCELVDAYGDIAATYDYAPFGAVSAGTPSGTTVPANPLQWSSEVYDSELGLVYYNYRHYSPSLGRFLSRDPIEEQGGWNLYGFLENNPLTRIDSIGREIRNSGSLIKRTDAYAFQKRGAVIYRKNAEIKHLGFYRFNHSTSTCCYYIGGIDVYLTVEGFYTDEASRRHEQLHMDTWLNTFYSFELVAKSILFKKDDFGETRNYLRHLLRFYEIRGWRDNSEIDMYAHKGMDDEATYRQDYIEASNRLVQQKKILDSMKEVLCSN